jgi:hypothetical protein
MARPKWTPRTGEQRRAIAAARRAAKRADEAEDLLWQAVGTALDLDVPAAFMADAVNRGRATLYRRLGTAHVEARRRGTNPVQLAPSSE